MESLFPIEINFTLFLQSLGDWLITPFKLITSLGNEEFYILIMPLLFWCINSVMGIRAGVMLLISGGIKDFAKVIIHHSPTLLGRYPCESFFCRIFIRHAIRAFDGCCQHLGCHCRQPETTLGDLARNPVDLPDRFIQDFPGCAFPA